MKPVAFDYIAVGDVEAARAAHTDTATSFMAGNQSLGPMLNLRLARPAKLIDVSMVAALRQVTETEDFVCFGSAITHAEIEDGEVPDPTGGWMQQVASNIAYRAVRNHGTLGGSLCHADPAADWGTVMPALGATALIDGPLGQRRLAIEAFILGPYLTALEPGEILTAIEVPKPAATARWGYWKYVQQVGEFAKASAAVLIDPANKRCQAVIGALGGAPCVLTDIDDLIAGKTAPAELLTAALPARPDDGVGLHAVALTRALAMATEDAKEAT
jgi:carbon-monoxide dehydrogenase medium subunit